MKYSEQIARAFYKEEGLPDPVFEHTFHPTRKWRFDIAWPEFKIALEIEGGVFKGGGHTSIKGFLKDIEKYNEAQMLGWHVMRCIPDEMCMVKTTDMISHMIMLKKEGIE